MENINWLPQDSEIAKLVREYDWSSSPLGPIDKWPNSLKTTLGLILGSNFPMFIWWGEERINLYNDAYAIIAGPAKHPQFFARPANMMWSEIWETIEPLARDVTSNKKSFSFEDLPLIIMRSGEDQEAFFTFSYSPLFALDGSVEGLVGVVQETTEQVRSRRQIEFEREKISTLFMNSPIAFVRTRGPEHVFDLINNAYLELIGHRDVLGRTVRESMPDLEGQGFYELLDETYRSGKRYISPEAEVQLERNGVLETRYVSFIYEPELDINGEVMGIIAIAHDITDIVIARKKEESSSRKLMSALQDRDISLRNLSTINKIGQQLTSILDQKKLVQTITDAGLEITGAQFGAFFYTVLDKEGKELLLYTVSGVPAEAFSNFPNPRATAVFHPTFMGEGTVRSDDITQDPRYGQNRPYGGIPEGHLPVKSYLAVSVISRTGEVIGGLFFGHEKPGVFSEQDAAIIEGLASQTAIAMDNARLYQNLQQSLLARDEFISIASHELKTPLTSLVLQAHIRKRLLSDAQIPGFEQERFERMMESDERQLQRLSRLVDDMLDISRIQTGKLTLDKSEVDLCDIVKEVLERFQHQFKDAQITYSFSSCEDSHVLADPFRLEQVVVNLLTNAIKYGNKKPVEVKVMVEGKEAILQVIDQGMGIKLEDQSRIFDRFERAVSKNEISGLGLGLSISREIIEAHGGRISVSSEIGKGSIFEIRIPVIA